ncbi:hypothetical protein [Lacrimispora sp.]
MSKTAFSNEDGNISGNVRLLSKNIKYMRKFCRLNQRFILTGFY